MADIPNITQPTQSPGASTTPSNFKPTYWEAAIEHNYYEVSAVGLITKPAPVIRGNKLVYNLASPVTITQSTTSDANNANVIYETVSPTPTEIDMDKIAMWGLQFNDITLFQTNLDLLNGEMYEAAMGMDETISQNVYADIYNSAGLSLGSIEVSALNAYDYIVDLGTQLDLKKVPKWGRYVMIDPSYLGMLSKDPRFTWKPKVLEKGIVEGEEIGGMQIVVSTELPTLKKGGTNGIFAIQKDGYGFGMQFDKTQHFPKLENSWNEAVRGRALYGMGVLRPNNIVSAAVTYNTSIQPNIVE